MMILRLCLAVHDGTDCDCAGLGCGGDVVMGINGSLTSPNFPGNFSDATTCTWSIRVPARRVLRLTFTYLATPGQADCASNYVEVFSGPTALSPTFGQFCNVSTLGNGTVLLYYCT